MVHFKDLLKETKYCSSFEVEVNKKGVVTGFESEFGNETIEDIQKLVTTLIGEGGITIRRKRTITINIDDIGDEVYPYCIDVFHNVDKGVQDDDSVIPYTQELIDKIMGS